MAKTTKEPKAVTQTPELPPLDASAKAEIESAIMQAADSMAAMEPYPVVVHASLHQPIVWGPAGINTEKTLSPTKTPGIKMYWCEHGLLLEKNGKTSLVPAPNVAIAQLE
jgi:hypothetical protein